MQAAREKLAYMSMSRKERLAYEDYMVSVHAAQDAWDTAIDDAKVDGWLKGRAQGHAEGLSEGMEKGATGKAMEVARNLKSMGLSVAVIVQATGLTEKQVNAL